MTAARHHLRAMVGPHRLPVTAAHHPRLLTVGRPPPPGYGRRGCDPRMAEDIARDYGFRRARVIDITPRRVIVQGFTRRGPDEISFGNVRGCPVLR
jgi:hypothetical protein